MELYDCPCCMTKQTVEEMEKGGYGICLVCGWEDDGVQRREPDETGANGKWTLNAARKAWKEGKTLFPNHPNPKALG